MHKRKTNRTPNTSYAVIVLSIVFLLSAGFFCLRLWENGRAQYAAPHPDDPYYMYQGQKYEQKENLETVLVLGLDKFEQDAGIADSYNNDKQADFLMLFVLDNDNKSCSALQINRDTMAEIHVLGVAGNTIDTVTRQIALAHTYGNGKEVSCRNTMDAVSALLFDRKIDHYISVTMDAVPRLNDLLGGVTLEIADDFSGLDETLVKGSTVTLTGKQALTYIRSRAGLEDSSNRKRMMRQKQYIRALYEKAVSRFAEDDAFMAETILQMAEDLVSNRSVTQLQALFRQIASYDFTGIRDIAGEERMGERFMEFYPDRASVEEVVVSLFYRPADGN